MIEAPESADAAVSQRIFLPVGSLWRVATWVKTQDLNSEDQSHPGGLINVETPIGDIGLSAGASGTTDWHQEDATFRVPSPSFVTLTLVGMRRGTEKVWFDDVRLEALATATREDVRIFAEHATGRPINAMQQGQFIEVLCNLIPSIIAPQVWSTSFEEAPPCKLKYKKEIDEPFRLWYPDGAVEVAQYSFDTANPFNGARSQKIELPVEHARAGISQDGFYLKQGVSYKLHVHMRSEGNVRVWASLHGGGGAIAGPVLLGSAGEGWGGVGTIEDYEWEHSIGPWDHRQPFSTVWGGLEENFVGIDEFIQLCQHVGAEPLICVRWAGNKPEGAAAEVEYCNGSVDTRWGKLRAQNGHPEPYHMEYFQIGNEVDAPDYNTTGPAFADAMKKTDPRIKLLSSYPTPSLLEAPGNAFDYLCPHHFRLKATSPVQSSLE